MRNMAMVLLLLAGAAYPLVSAYHIEPVNAHQSGWALGDENHGVSQVLTCSWDELDSASGSYVEFFQGDTLTGSPYKLDIYEYPDGVTPVASNAGVRATRPQSWVKLPLAITPGKSFTKGKLYEFRFTRSGSDSIQFYWQVNDPYPYKDCQILVGGQPYQSLADLAMRCYGRMRPIQRADFGLCLPAFAEWYDDTTHKQAWTDTLVATGAGWATLTLDWSQIEARRDTFDWTAADNYVERVGTGIEPVAILLNCPKWASTTNQWYWDDEDSVTYWDSSIHCPPINLDTGFNYYARWVDSVVHRFGDRIHSWIISNEPNDTCTDPSYGATGWWRRPTRYYLDLGDGARPLCSLYVRLCRVANTVIKAAGERGSEGHFPNF